MDPDTMDDLEALLAESLAAQREARQVATARKRLAAATPGQLPPSLRENLESLISHYDETRLWRTTANVALVQVQTCTNCGATHKWFSGWMREQRHRTAANTRRLVVGRAPDSYPTKIEEHHSKPIDHCADCLPASIAATVHIAESPTCSSPLHDACLPAA